MSFLNLLELLSGIALFLYGVSLMGNGLNMAAGNKLELILYKLTGNPLKGLLLGAVVTALIQSSSAASVMVVGFVNSGMMQFAQAVYIILGSILGTSITAWITSLSEISTSGGILDLFSTTSITCIFSILGIILYKFTKKKSGNYIGGILLGFAVLMTGMTAMSTAVAPLKESETFLTFLTTFSNPLLGILAGMVFTCVIQSSAAAVGVLQALAVTGALDVSTAFPIILGIAVGGAVPVLLSALGAETNGVRTAFAHLLMDVFGALICGILFYLLNAILHFSFLETKLTMVGVAILNTLFRLVAVILLFPAMGLLSKLACLLIPEKKATQQRDLDKLEALFIPHPALALEQTHCVIDSMAVLVKGTVFNALELLTSYRTSEDLEEIRAAEVLSDRYQDTLSTYLVKISATELNEWQEAALYGYLRSITDLERISDHALNIGECCQEIHEKNISFSEKGLADLFTLMDAVKEIIELTISSFTESNAGQAREIEPLEEWIDTLCDEIKSRHVTRLQKGSCSLESGFAYNELLTNLERVADHCSNIAISVIEAETKTFDSHSYSDNIKLHPDEDFESLYQAYSRRFALKEAN